MTDYIADAIRRETADHRGTPRRADRDRRQPHRAPPTHPIRNNDGDLVEMIQIQDRKSDDA
jgi:hypothetical protein